MNHPTSSAVVICGSTVGASRINNCGISKSLVT